VTLSAAILAGGQARRYGGADKSALVVEGRTIRERQLETLRTITADVRVIDTDRVPGCGPLGGLHTALEDTTADATIVVACDMPYLSAPLLRYLADLAREADAVVPRTERGYHPLCAVYTRACVAPITRRLAAHQLKMTDLLEDLRVRVVAAEELNAFGNPQRLLANVNSPADHREIEALQDHKL
jgi:molybdenum cofactor guanylyltransferase